MSPTGADVDICSINIAGISLSHFLFDVFVLLPFSLSFTFQLRNVAD